MDICRKKYIYLQLRLNKFRKQMTYLKWFLRTIPDIIRYAYSKVSSVFILLYTIIKHIVKLSGTESYKINISTISITYYKYYNTCPITNMIII